MLEAYKSMTDSMFYVLLCLYEKDTFGTEIVSRIYQLSHGEINMGPGTLYTILSRFEKDGLIDEIAVDGRKRTYTITLLGKRILKSEFNRLQRQANSAKEIIKQDEKN